MLQDGRSGDRIPVGARFFSHVQNGPGTHPSSYTMGTGSFPGVKRQRRGSDHPSQPSVEVKERVELYVYSVSGSYHCLLKPYIQERRSISICLFVCFWRDSPPVGQSLLLRAPQSVGLLWTTDQLVAETST